MPNTPFDELLASFEGEDEDPTEAVEAEPKKDNTVIKQIRDHGRRLEKELEKARKESDELKAWKTEFEARSKAEVLGAAGLNSRQQAAYLALNQDVTPEAIQDFKAEVLGVGEAPEDTNTGFGPADVSGERNQAGKFYTREDIKNILRENPGRQAELEAANRQGRVRWT